MSGEGEARYEYRRDGWPLCPRCGEDELYSLVSVSNPGRRAEPIDRMACYRCSWTGLVPARAEVEAVIKAIEESL